MPRCRPAPWRLCTAVRHVSRERHAAARRRCVACPGRRCARCTAQMRRSSSRTGSDIARCRPQVQPHARQAVSAWPSTMRGAVTTPVVAMPRRSGRARAALVRRAGCAPRLPLAHCSAFLPRAAGAGRHRRRGAACEERGHDGAGRRADGLHWPLRHQGAHLARLQGAPRLAQGSRAPDGLADGASLPQVIAFSREKAGVGGKKSKDDVERDFAGAYKVVFGDVTVRAIVAASGRTCADAARRRAWTRCARLRSLRRWTSSCRASPAALEGSRCVQPAGASCADC
jgi:hypothetical protein